MEPLANFLVTHNYVFSWASTFKVALQGGYFGDLNLSSCCLIQVSSTSGYPVQQMHCCARQVLHLSQPWVTVAKDSGYTLLWNGSPGSRLLGLCLYRDCCSSTWYRIFLNESLASLILKDSNSNATWGIYAYAPLSTVLRRKRDVRRGVSLHIHLFEVFFCVP